MLKTQKINIVQEFDAPIDKVFATLSEHENLSKLLPLLKLLALVTARMHVTVLALPARCLFRLHLHLLKQI